MSRDWVPAGSIPYDMAYADGDTMLRDANDGTIPYISGVPYRPPKVRSDKQCIGNDHTCKGFKASGTNYCAGHLKGIAKAQAASEAKAALVLLGLVA